MLYVNEMVRSPISFSFLSLPWGCCSCVVKLYIDKLVNSLTCVVSFFKCLGDVDLAY